MSVVVTVFFLKMPAFCFLFYFSLCLFLLNAPGAEGETGETAGCPGRPVQSQGGKTERAAEAQTGGARKEEERGGGGNQVNTSF